VELTVAIHRVFDTEKDRLVFDVGHQCYVHKILTGREDKMNTLRTFGGLAGYPKPIESPHDSFIAGHASNAVSVALGMARARTLLGEDYHVLALMGDGALTGGLSYEGLSDAGQSGEPLLIILNDNGMSITKNVGGVAQHLAHQRLKPQYLFLKKIYRKITSVIPLGKQLYHFTHKLKKGVKESLLPCSLFEDMGFTYLGPVDGHDVKLLTHLLTYVKAEVHGPAVLHVRTVKGKGYLPAEQNPDEFHGVSPFIIATGEPVHPSLPGFSSVFGENLCKLAEQDQRICAISAAMVSGTGLSSFAERFPKRFFDVGIAEGHAVTMASGMAKQGMIPVFAVYSSFLQRGFDMLIHDAALLQLHVVFAIDRAGLVGDDGETHHGIFDVGFLDLIPGMTVLAPSSFSEVGSMLDYAIHKAKGPVAIRYPRGGEDIYQGNSGTAPTSILSEGQDVTIVTYGTMVGPVLQVADKLGKDGIHAELLKCNVITPIDYKTIAASVQKTGRLIVVEDCVEMNCVGRRILSALSEEGIPLKQVALVNLGADFVTHGKISELRKFTGLDVTSIYQLALEVCQRGKKTSGFVAI
jgi:1-deoxy-D-xylulose-5-phosphate synthase